MRRYLPALAALLGLVVVVGGALGGGGAIGGGGVGLVGLILLGLIGVWWLIGRRQKTTDVTWDHGSVSGRTPSPTRGPGRGSVSASLARVEGRELVASPWFGVGVGFWVLGLAAFGLAFEDENERGWWFFFGLSSMLANPFAGMVVVAVHRNYTRPRRDGCGELFGACPADDGARSLGFLLVAWIPALVSAGFFIGLAVMVAVGNPRMFGPIDHEAAAAVVTVAALAAGAVALGVTLGRWAPWALAPFVAVVAVGLADGALNGIGQPSWATDRFLATALAPPDVDMLFVTRPVWERAVWLLALGVLVASLAFVSVRRATVPRLVAGGALAVALVAGVLVVRPGSEGDVASIASLVTDAPAHQVCRNAGRELKVCAYESYGRVADLMAEDLTPVAAAVPPGVLSGVAFGQGFEQRSVKLQSEVADQIAGQAGSETSAPDLLLRFNLHPENVAAARMRLGARAVGLPTESGEGRRPLIVAGQSRGVVVLWLATRGLGTKQARQMVADGSTDGGPAGPTITGSIWPGICHDEGSVLVWAPKDLVAARMLLNTPSAKVRAVIHEHWDAVIDPAATTDDLLELLGFGGLGEPEIVQSQAASC